MPRGYLALVLHAHLPFIRHPEHDSFLEESWLFEAITESYIPLLQAFERLAADGIDFRLTLSLSPPLLTMLGDPLLRQRYVEHLGRLIDLAERERHRLRAEPRLQQLEGFYLALFRTTLELYEVHYRRDLVSACRRLQEAGALELITTGATHGYLPLLRTQGGAVRAQLEVAARFHRRTLGGGAPGVWLPECGYYPGLEDAVRAAGFGYFFLESHGLLNAVPRPRRGLLAPVVCANGVAAFARDPASSHQVWSARDGYPGDPLYREFHRDIGFERTPGDLGPLFPEGLERVPTGIKYYRVTGPGTHKAPYDPAAARERARVHAGHFAASRIQALEHAAAGEPAPLILAPYDAELFGHWWFEGPLWLEYLIRELHRQRARIGMLTPSDYLSAHGRLQQAQPAGSSWGEGGYNRFWLSDQNSWIYPHLHQAARDMEALVRRCDGIQDPEPQVRALRQAGRSLLLAQASDWPFIMRSGTAVDYALSRMRDHLARFRYLKQALMADNIDGRRLAALEIMDNIFPDLDYRLFAADSG